MVSIEVNINIIKISILSRLPQVLEILGTCLVVDANE